MKQLLMKNIPAGAVFSLAAEVNAQPGQVVSKTIAQNGAVSVTLFAFDKGEEIGAHQSDGDALVMALEGEGCITVAGESFTLRPGDSILMPAGKPHAVYASESFKMFLIVVFPQAEKE